MTEETMRYPKNYRQRGRKKKYSSSHNSRHREQCPSGWQPPCKQYNQANQAGEVPIHYGDVYCPSSICMTLSIEAIHTSIKVIHMYHLNGWAVPWVGVRGGILGEVAANLAGIARGAANHAEESAYFLSPSLWVYFRGGEVEEYCKMTKGYDSSKVARWKYCEINPSPRSCYQRMRCELFSFDSSY